MTLNEADLQLTTDELVERIGREASAAMVAAKGQPRSYWVRRGEAWLQAKQNAIAAAICGSDALRELWRDEKQQETVVLVTAVADLLSSVVTGVSPFTVALLLVRRGLGRICAEWKQ